MSNTTPDRIAFLDIESTGLVARTDLTLEVGIVIVDRQLQEIANSSVLISTPQSVAWANLTLAQRDRGDQLDIAQQMHLDNGLIDQLLYPNTFLVDPDGTVHRNRAVATDYNSASDRLRSFLDAQGITEQVPLAGSSVRSLDGPFLAAHMPKLYSRFNHRTIDASALTELAKFVDPAGYEAIMATVPASGHRTIGDCRRSIDIVRAFGARYGVGSLSAAEKAQDGEAGR